ncbi:MAG: hypothetical protein C4522_08065 [Desulfobacteraceae bacterium]|nr:MAG: hypothetical protein C4522_08065 [Desulfobacteraceae bacterium]
MKNGRRTGLPCSSSGITRKPIDLNQFIKVMKSIERFRLTIVSLPSDGGGNERTNSDFAD